MLSYIIRLDDACPTMHHKNWDRVEDLLDKYNIKPIVGIIPECMDEMEHFRHQYDDGFWDRALEWQKKGWTIAQHGLYHKYYTMEKGTKLFQLSNATFTEFAGKSCGEQKMMLNKGYRILKKYGIEAKCFFAPGHTFDKNTVRACRELRHYEFISDGCALKPYKKAGMSFMPAISSTPQRLLSFGVYTFVLHPSVMTDKSIKVLEDFIEKEAKRFVSANWVLENCRIKRGQGIFGRMIEAGMYLMRKVKRK